MANNVRLKISFDGSSNEIDRIVSICSLDKVDENTYRKSVRVQDLSYFIDVIPKMCKNLKYSISYSGIILGRCVGKNGKVYEETFETNETYTGKEHLEDYLNGHDEWTIRKLKNNPKLK